MTNHYTRIAVLASSTVFSSPWDNTNFPQTEEYLKIFDIGETTGISSAVYMPMLVSGGTTSVLMEAQIDRVPTSACVITAATVGDIYNIGGIAGEGTDHIVITLWENSGYGRGKGR
jgi:hypothetical protein